MNAGKWLRLKDYIFARMQEASFWRSIFILFGGSMGTALAAPDRAEAWISMAMIAAGLLGLLLPDNIPLTAAPAPDPAPTGANVDTANAVVGGTCPRCNWPQLVPVAPGS